MHLLMGFNAKYIDYKGFQTLDRSYAYHSF